MSSKLGNQNPYREYVIVGRRKPTEVLPNPPLYRMRVFARNSVAAKSRYWHLLSSLKKLKASNGQILSIDTVTEDSTTVHNYGIWLRYTSKAGILNMYKEYRDVTRVGAVYQLYQDMAGRHHANISTIQIIDIKVIEDKDVRRSATAQLVDPEFKFPLPHRPIRFPKHNSKVFVYRRPLTNVF